MSTYWTWWTSERSTCGRVPGAGDDDAGFLSRADRCTVTKGTVKRVDDRIREGGRKAREPWQRPILAIRLGSKKASCAGMVVREQLQGREAQDSSKRALVSC